MKLNKYVLLIFQGLTMKMMLYVVLFSPLLFKGPNVL